MAGNTIKAQLTAHYCRICFCDRPQLPEGPTVAYEPRFEFAKAAKSYAKALGIADLNISKFKTAQGESAIVCDHGANWVRMDWEMR